MTSSESAGNRISDGVRRSISWRNIASASAPSIWVAGENDVWLGGSAIWHFDGVAWSESAPMAAVDFWGLAANDIWSTDGSRV